MTDRRSVIRTMQQIGCEYVRETRHGELWRLPNRQTMILSHERNWGDSHTPRNVLAELKRKLGGSQLAV